MANDKFYGYSPKTKKGNVGVPYGNDNRLDRFNPYEFRKGMDYELSTIGISRLSESTPEQREKSTEKVLKNLNTYPAYYSCKIQFETEYRNFQGRKPSFKKYMDEKYENKMKPVDQEYKNDKMVTLKEAIKNEIRSIIAEKKRPDYPDVDKDGDREESMEKALKDKEAKAKGKKSSKKEAKKDKGDGEKDDDQIAKDIEKKMKSGKSNDPLVDITDQIKDLGDEKTDLRKKLEPHMDDFKAGKLDKDAYMKKVKGIPERIKAINKELSILDKKQKEAEQTQKNETKEVALTTMDRDVNRRLLEIIKESGVNLYEGAQGIKVHYDIARNSYMEGLMAGLNRE